MLIRRQVYSNKQPMKKSQDSGIEMRALYKKEDQPASPVNKLLNTAAAGASMVRDVETLLTPIHEQQHRDEEHFTVEQQLQASKERTERNLWRNDEVMEMLYTMQNVKALEKLNDKTVKSENVFKDVEVIMHKNGFVKKSHVQIWTKWKFLKSTYMTSRRNGVIPRMVPPQIYEMLHQMVNGINQGMSDCGNSTNGSIDGDSMGGGVRGGGGGGGMVISGVEGGISDAVNGDDDDSYGMAHPIFGFRLGIVKSEPTDTGYDAMENTGSDKDPLEEQAALSRSERQVKEEHQKIEDKAKKSLIKPLEVVPHRGRGRPPKHPPAATSTPTSTTVSPASRSCPQMPPLRVAPFAKAAHSANALAANRPPPPLTMPPTPRIRIANLATMTNGDTVKFIQRKLMPKPSTTPQSSAGQTVRLSKELTIQTRRSSSPSPSYPKMKQIPMRKTPYSLRPDRAIPDLDASLSPPPPAVEKYSSKKVEEVPSTKHLIMQSNGNSFQNTANRKRRFECQEPLPSKQAKYATNVEEDDEHFKTDKADEDGKHYGKVLQNVIIDLSSSLRKMQTQMMRDFFNKQNDLLQKEHEFQLQQDRMIMRAFQQQTQEIMHSVKQLVGTISNKKTETPHLTKGHLRKDTKTNGTSCSRRLQPKENLPSDFQEQDVDDVRGGTDQEDQEVEAEEDEQMEQEQDGSYTDDEEDQQGEMEDQEDNDQEENEEDDGNDDQPENQQDDEEVPEINSDEDEEDDDESESDTPEQDPIHMVSSVLTED